jgi:predicted transcriptional regulator
MKTYSKITLGAAALAFATIMIANKKKVNAQKQISEIANEGYETAADILNINKGKSVKKMHFGPVLPHHTF